MNKELAYKVLDQIKAHPETHKQGQWRCATGMCFAGWTAELTGAEWVVPVDDLIRVKEDSTLSEEEAARISSQAYEVIDPESGERQQVWNYALDVLELPHEGLFDGANTIQVIESYIENDGEFADDDSYED